MKARASAKNRVRCGPALSNAITTGVLGVLAIFDRGRLDDRSLEWLRVFADYAAESIANARAVEEIDVLRARLEPLFCGCADSSLAARSP